MKARVLLIVLCVSVLNVFSQTEEDALRYSQVSLMGSARYMALGGAYGAIGADFTGLVTNPAGIGLFRKSEMSFTPLLTYNKNEAIYYGQQTEETQTNFRLGNFGVVLTNLFSSGRQSGWKSVHLGLGYNRTNNFRNEYVIQGYNTNNSLMTGYVHKADGFRPENLDPFTTGLAYDTWLIWPKDTINYIYDTDAYRGNVYQSLGVSTSGSMNEWSFVFGSNYNDWLYLGAYLGIPYIRYYSESFYSETDPNNLHPEFISFNRNDFLETRGTGVNFKIGAIVRPAEWLRLGGSFHTPTYYWNMRDAWSSWMGSELIIDNIRYSRSQASPLGNFDYELTTPLKAIGSAAFIVKKYGLISFEYEFVDYSKTKFNSSRYSYSEENANISNYYTAGHNLKFGTEWRVDSWYFRGGYALYSSPYKSDINDGERNQISLGLGFRQRDYYVDLAWVMNNTNQDKYMYWVPDNEGFNTPVADQTLKTQLYMLTLGWRF